MSSPLELFPVATVVELHSLVTSPEHNGHKGVVFGATSERLSVQIEPVAGSAIRGLRAFKLSNVRAVSEDSVSPALRNLILSALNDRIRTMQNKMETGDFDPVAHAALVGQHAKNLKKLTKVGAHDPDEISFANKYDAGVGQSIFTLCQQHRFRLCC